MIRHKTKSNPTDHDLISKLTVKKSFPDYGTMYEVYLDKRRIGFADIDHGKTEISFVNINEEYRRKGVSSFLYDYIEKDLGRKLKPSADLLDDGEAFWKTRNKRSNPRDEELLKTIKIQKKKFYDDSCDEHGTLYKIYSNDEYIGRAEILDDSDNVYYAWIYKSENRNKGVMSFVYDYIEKDLKIKLKPSNNQLEGGKAFWETRSKKNNPNKNPSPKPKLRKLK